MLESSLVQDHEKIPLAFRVHWEFLKNETEVPDPVWVIFTGHYPLKFMEKKILGESGIEMFFRNGPFQMTRKLAEELIEEGFARLYDENMPHMFS